jgi:hypothetical protein
MNEKIYIKYGDNKFDINKWNQIKNQMHVKPFGGLWGSDINAKFSWKDWCEENDFFKNDFNKSFKFKLKKYSNILTITNCSQIYKLPTQNGKLFEQYGISINMMLYIDFEKLKKTYDALEILISSD